MAAIAIEVSKARLTSIDSKLPMRRLHECSHIGCHDGGANCTAESETPGTVWHRVVAVSKLKRSICAVKASTGCLTAVILKLGRGPAVFLFLVSGTIFYIRAHKKYHSLYNYIAHPILLFCELPLIALALRWTLPPYSLRYLGVEKDE